MFSGLEDGRGNPPQSASILLRRTEYYSSTIQSGYQKNFSITTALYCIDDDFYKAIDNHFADLTEYE